MTTLLTLVILTILTLAAVSDVRTRLIPDRYPLLLLLCAGAGVWVFPALSLRERLLGCFVVSLPMLLLALVVPGSFGGGDVKLMFAAGAVLGWRMALWCGCAAVLTGGTYGAWLLLCRRARAGDTLVFGPFLCAGAALAHLFGEELSGMFFL